MTDKESLTGIAQQMTEQTKSAMENYFSWLQKNMSALPWSNTNLNTVLLSNATQNVTATFAFVQKLNQRISKTSSKFKPTLWRHK